MEELAKSVENYMDVVERLGSLESSCCPVKGSLAFSFRRCDVGCVC